LDQVQEQAATHGFEDPLVPSTDIYMTAILSVGSKSLSHVLSTIDRCKERLLAVGTQSELARRQIIGSVVDFWVDHPGNAVNIVDKLLNYTIITPMSVIEWALQDRLDRGRALASAQCYELISTTMFKVTERLRQIVQTRNDTKVSFDQRQQIDEVLPRERQSARDMYLAIEDAVAAVASGTQDDMIERYDDNNSERDLITLWGERWARVWRRKAAVEEAVVGEAAVAPLEEPEPEPVVAAEGEQGMDTADDIE
jgi:nuclear cap-binding protein subunit 1